MKLSKPETKSTRRRPAAPRPAGPFRLDARLDGPVRNMLFSASRPALSQALALREMNRIYAEIASWDGDERHFCEKAIEALGVSVSVPQAQLDRVPREGPFVLVSNHPFGGLEGLILPALLRAIRPDLKLLANFVLHSIPDMRDMLYFVNPFGGPVAAKQNMAATRSAIRHLEQGGALGVFPAGEVSHLKFRHREVTDPPWHTTVARLVQRTKAPVLPVFFDGRNSDLFQLLGMIHPRLRTVMLPREMLKKRHSTVSLAIGSPIQYRRLEAIADEEGITDYLRVRTYLLKSRKHGPAGSGAQARHEPIAAPTPPHTLESEIAALPAEQKLVSNGSMQVLYVRSDQAPGVLHELGRLREQAFRKVGEGTGRPLDLDAFDRYYHHLFVWDTSLSRIVGAYRLGRTDEILPTYGKQGLYSNTLFRFKPRLIKQLDPGLELGRSFVHPDYQKSFAPLMLLWKGIGHYIVRFPRYRMLFGPVSISAEYATVSKQLLIAFLKLNRYLPSLARWLKPMNPPRMRPIDAVSDKQTSIVVRSVDEVNELLADLEADGKTMPVLLRQYLKLNAKLLGFNIDPEFGDVLDGLMLIDLLEVDTHILNKYMGREGHAAFRAQHGATPPTA